MRALLVLLVLGGCASTDPVLRSDLWRPTGVNDANLQAMIVDPLDLVNGTGSKVSDGSVAADAVTRYRTGKVKALPDAGLAKIGVSGGSGGGSAPAAN